MLVTLLGMLTDAKLLHPQKAQPIEVTLFGMLTDIRPLQLWKA